MNKILKRPEKINLYKLTYDGVRQFERVINELRDEIKYKKANKIKNSVDESVLEIIKELPNISDENSNEIIQMKLLTHQQ